MRLTVLGGCGAWPDAGQACSGYLVENDGFRLLVDPGYATVPRLLQQVTADDVDAVFVSHGHPDHCADLNPLLRARALRDDLRPPPMPVYALPGALDAVLALDRAGMLDSAYTLHEFAAGDHFDIGPFGIQTRLLPHFMPNAGVRLAAGGQVLAYTGDSGPSPVVADLARGADLLLAEASFAGEVPEDSRRYLSSARVRPAGGGRSPRPAAAAGPPDAGHGSGGRASRGECGVPRPGRRRRGRPGHRPGLNSRRRRQSDGRSSGRSRSGVVAAQLASRNGVTSASTSLGRPRQADVGGAGEHCELRVRQEVEQLRHVEATAGSRGHRRSAGFGACGRSQLVESTRGTHAPSSSSWRRTRRSARGRERRPRRRRASPGSRLASAGGPRRAARSPGPAGGARPTRRRSACRPGQVRQARSRTRRDRRG